MTEGDEKGIEGSKSLKELAELWHKRSERAGRIIYQSGDVRKRVMRDIVKYIIFNPGSPEESSFFSTRRAKESGFTGESNEEIIAALRTSYSREPMF